MVGKLYVVLVRAALPLVGVGVEAVGGVRGVRAAHDEFRWGLTVVHRLLRRIVQQHRVLHHLIPPQTVGEEGHEGRAEGEGLWHVGVGRTRAHGADRRVVRHRVCDRERLGGRHDALHGLEGATVQVFHTLTLGTAAVGDGGTAGGRDGGGRGGAIGIRGRRKAVAVGGRRAGGWEGGAGDRVGMREEGGVEVVRNSDGSERVEGGHDSSLGAEVIGEVGQRVERIVGGGRGVGVEGGLQVGDVVGVRGEGGVVLRMEVARRGVGRVGEMGVVGVGGVGWGGVGEGVREGEGGGVEVVEGGEGGVRHERGPGWGRGLHFHVVGGGRGGMHGGGEESEG